MHELGTIDPPRKLRTDELAVLQRLLSEDFPGVAELRQQIPFLRVREECTCGCPSVTFALDKEGAPRAEVDNYVRIEGFARGGKKTAISLMLFFLNGHIEELEVLGYRGKTPKQLPAVDELKVEVVI